ncbi:MAG TPA: haloacid dehalogenase [Dehalococcoidia bacterium]|nr:haloacid dehalogenase [Dehalococcoidia bacterium]
MSKLMEDLEIISTNIRSYFIVENELREKVLPLCRQVTQYSAIAIRAVHRQEQGKAKQLLDSAHKLIQEINLDLSESGELLHSGFVHDAQKEFAEGCITLALISEKNLPEPETLDISYAAYLNGLGEAIGELRRYILDSLRRGDFSRGEELLAIMDDIHGILMTMDFPEVVTHGLRRTSDATRGIIERTRGDLTIALRQRELEIKLDNSP